MWTNLHGGFLVVFSLLAARLAESLVLSPRLKITIRRDAVLAISCLAATFVNPYGWRLHQHILEYLSSDWLRQSIEEFQSPKFRSESMMQFEILLAIGIATLPYLWKQRRVAEILLLLFWAQQALSSVRNVPIYCLLAGPVIASRLNDVWEHWAAQQHPKSFARLLHQISNDWQRWSSGFSAAPAVVCFLLFLLPAGKFPSDFPSLKFPVEMVSRNEPLFSPTSGAPLRIFSTDQWSNYLIYRLYPRVAVFFDGRSDFFASWRGRDYGQLMEGRPGSLAILRREKVELALLPADWSLAGILASDPHWIRIDSDSQAVLFRIRPGNTNKP